MKPFPIPVVTLGADSRPIPGSQAIEEPLDFMPMPTQMATFISPSRPEVADPAVVGAARRLLEAVLAQARDYDFAGQTLLEIDMTSVTPAVLRYVSEALSQGEVSAIVQLPAALRQHTTAVSVRVQESAFPAFWRILHCNAAGEVVRDLLEVGGVPDVVVAAALAGSHAGVTPAPRVEGVMNGPPILAELAAAAARFADSGETHIVNFTLLPVSPEDMQFLIDSLGIGPVTLLSRGYGNCRITATGLRNVWWVQYFNSMDQMILNTIEVARVPEVALAAQEDFSDSLERLAEWIETLE